jgi:NAD+ synthase (glutamine-hydrolysing)
MNIIKVGSGVVNQTPMDWKQNLKNCIDVIEEARAENVSVLCLPELALSGYGCEDAFYSPDLRKQALDSLFELLDHTADMVVCVGLPLEIDNKIYNTACLIANKQILGFACKQHLPNYGLFYEDRWFQRWPGGVKSEVTLKNISYPVGDLIFEMDGLKIGIEICEDAWVPGRPADRHFAKGADIILNPSASPFEFFKFQTRENLIVESSRSHSCTYVYANLLGNESGRLIFDGDAQIASNGVLLESSPRFSYANHTLTTAVIDTDMALVDSVKIKIKAAPANNLVKSNFIFPTDVEVNYHVADLEPFERGGYLKEEEFARAV